jgi:hypothetical protein
VYEDYEVRRSEDGTGFVQVAARGTTHEAGLAESYEPITDTPHLFLEFARLVESKSTGEALMDWISRYGVPGFSHGRSFDGTDPLVESVPQSRHDDKGGVLDSFENIWDVAWEANQSLLLYEAATGGDEQKLEQILFSDEDGERSEFRRQAAEARAEAKGSTYRDGLVSAALFRLTEYAMGPLVSYCYPVISYPPRYLRMLNDDAPPLTPDQLSRGWGARNLLGAMGLQFYWLVTSGGELDRCRYCGRIISHAPPVASGDKRQARKRRNDREFCDSRCRQNYHYHNRVKPERSRKRR